MGGLITKHSVSKALIADQVFRQNVPETEMYSKSVLKMMLGKYKMVYIKPNRGTGGNGVIRVQKAGPDQYKYQLQMTTKKFTSSDNLINSLELELQGSS